MSIIPLPGGAHEEKRTKGTFFCCRVVATIDVKEQKLKPFLDKIQVEEYEYPLQ